MAGPQGPIGQQGQHGEKGDPGLPGAKGEQGERGPQGAAAGSSAGYQPRYWVSCVATLDLITVTNGTLQRSADGLKETLLDYTLTLYTDRDVDVSCSAGIGSSQSGAGSSYYPSVTNGAATAGCTASADYPSAGGMAVGFWFFQLQSGPQTTYMDSDNPLGLDGSVHRFTESECSSFTLGTDASWTQVTLADVF